MIDKANRSAATTEARKLPFSVTPLTFDFTCPLPIDETVTRLKKMALTEPPTDVALLRIDAETQRFNIRTRALRSHLVESNGYLRKIDDSSTRVTGEAYGGALAVGLLAATVIAALLVILVTWSLWAVALGIAAVLVLAIYSRGYVLQVDADEKELVRLIQSAFS